MGKNKENNIGCVGFAFIVLIVTTIWDFILMKIYFGTLGLYLIMLYSIGKIIHSIIHNIHYDKFISLSNPFFLMLIYGGWFLLSFFTPISIIRGANWFTWFNPNSPTRQYVSTISQIIGFPCLIITSSSYYVLGRSLIKKEDD